MLTREAWGTKITVAIMVLTVTPLTAWAQVYPDARNEYVNDFAGVLTAGDTRALKDALQTLEEESGVEGTVVTVSTVGQYGGGGIEAFATGLFNKWGVATKNETMAL